MLFTGICCASRRLWNLPLPYCKMCQSAEDDFEALIDAVEAARNQPSSPQPNSPPLYFSDDEKDCEYSFNQECLCSWCRAERDFAHTQMQASEFKEECKKAFSASKYGAIWTMEDPDQLDFPIGGWKTLPAEQHHSVQQLIDTVPDPPLVGIEENPGPDLVNITPQFKLHGKYVGPGHTGGKKLGDVDFRTKPIDKLDEAARVHDWQYTQHPENKGAADWKLAKSAWNSIGKNKSVLADMKALAVAGGMGAMSVIGSKNGEILTEPPKPGEYVGASRRKQKKFVRTPGFVGGMRVSRNWTGRNDARDVAGMRSTLNKRLPVQSEKGKFYRQTYNEHVQPYFQQGVKNPEVVSQINGNNGEATNSDDVPKNMQPKKERKIEKKIEKKVEKTVKKQKKQKKTKDKPKPKAVDSGLTATTFQETSTIQPYYLPGSKPFSKKTLFSLGVVNAQGVSSGSQYVNGGVNQSIPIDKNVFIGQSIGRDLDNFEMGRILWARYHFVPSIGSTTAGACWIFSDPDAVDVLPATTVVQSSLLNSHKGSKKHTIWKDAFTGSCNFNKNWLYLDSAIQTYSNSTATAQVNNTGDPRLTTFGVLSFINGENINTSGNALGEWFLECEFEFRYPQFNDLSKFILSNKCLATLQNALFSVGNGTTFDPFMAAHTCYTTQTTVQQYEDSYNPRMVFPTGINSGGGNMRFALPVGIYNFYFRMSQISNGALTSYYPTVNYTISNCTYSITVDRLLTNVATTAVAPPEFASANNPNLDPLGNGACGFNIRLRIDAIAASTVATISFTMSVSTSGTFLAGAFHANVERLPDYSASPVCMFHPQGSANTYVGLSNDVRISIWNGFRCDEARSHVYTMICPREFIDMVKAKMMVRWLESEEKYCFVYVDNQKGDSFPPLASSFDHWDQAPELYVNRKELEEQDKKFPRAKTISRDEFLKRLGSSEVGRAQNDAPIPTFELPKQNLGLDEKEHDHFCSHPPSGFKPVTMAEEPESPEIVENPMTKSIHLNAAAVAAAESSGSNLARALKALVPRK